MAKKQPTTPIEEERLAQDEAEAMARLPQEASQDQINDEQAEYGETGEHAADADASLPAEVAAIHLEPEEQVEGDKGKSAKEKGKQKAEKQTQSKNSNNKERGAKYQEARKVLETGKLYRLDEAIELVKKMSFTKFEGGIELHIRLSQKKSKGNTESSKGVFHLPHGTGKNKKIVLLTEEKIEEIAKTKKIDFDIALASPELMPKVARIAKILGPQGKMPDPKSGTVTTDPNKTIEEINSGRVDYRIDASNNIHQLVGKTSWEVAKLIENIQAILSSYPKSRVVSAYLVASMSPSVPLDLAVIK